jgi:hypothetical protein
MTPASDSNSPSQYSTVKFFTKSKNTYNKLPSATTIALRKCREEAQKLPTNVSSYFLDQGKRLISSVIENQEKSAKLNRLKQDEFVPRSLKSAIELSGSNDVSRTTTFMTLATSLDTTSSVYVSSVKEIMVEAALLERNQRNLKIFEQFLNFCRLCFQYQIMELGAPSTLTEATTDDPELLYALLTEILFCSADFLENFRETNIDLAIDDLVATRAKVFPGVNDTKYAEFKNIIDTTHDSFTQLLDAVKVLVSNICLYPISAYNTHLKVILKEAQRREFIANQQALSTANNTTLMMDEEPATTPKLLRSLITQELQKELQRLNISKKTDTNKNYNGKNSRRGAIHTTSNVVLNNGASLKNKKQKKSPKNNSNISNINPSSVPKKSQKKSPSNKNQTPKKPTTSNVSTTSKKSNASQRPRTVVDNANVGRNVKQNRSKSKLKNKTKK